MSCAASLAAAVLAWKAITIAVAALTVLKTASRLLKFGAAWAAVEQAAMWVLERCKSSLENDCVVTFMAWARNVTDMLCIAEFLTEVRDVGSPH